MGKTDINEYTESLREKLMQYGTAAKELEAAYKQALKQNEQAHAQTKAELDAKRFGDMNAAAADSIMRQKNSDVLLASRGLSSSGERRQSYADGENILKSRLSDIAVKHSEASKQANAERVKADSDALEALTKGKDALFEKQEKAKQQLAEAEEKAYIERNEAAYDHAKKEEAAHDGAPAPEESGNGHMLTEKEMVKNIISSCCDGRTVKTENEKAYIRVMLENLEAELGLDPEYRSGIDKLLASYGYTPMELSEAEGIASATTAADSLDRWTTEFYRAVRNSSIQPSRTAYETARKKAKELQKEYVYTHCTDLDAVRIAMKRLGYNTYDTEKFIKEAANSDSYSLGMHASYKD